MQQLIGYVSGENHGQTVLQASTTSSSSSTSKWCEIDDTPTLMPKFFASFQFESKKKRTTCSYRGSNSLLEPLQNPRECHRLRNTVLHQHYATVWFLTWEHFRCSTCTTPKSKWNSIPAWVQIVLHVVHIQHNLSVRGRELHSEVPLLMRGLCCTVMTRRGYRFA